MENDIIHEVDGQLLTSSCNASSGMDCCLTSSWNANAKLSGAEVVDEFGCGEGVRTFGHWLVPYVTNGDEADTTRLLFKCM